MPYLCSFIGDPDMARVNKCCNNSHKIFLKDLANELRADPLVSRFTPISARLLPNNQWLDATRQAILTASQHFHFKAMGIAPLDLHFKAQFIEDTNLIKIYSRLPGSPALPDLTPAEQAEQIRNWMRDNQGMLDNITNLDLDRLNLSTIPSEVGLLRNLVNLNLRSNQLAALPPEIGNLGNLERLDLAYNQLEALPPEIGNLGNLQELNLFNNQLTALPPEIGNLGELRTLYLGHNQLAALPREIGNLGELTTLYLKHNQLAALPREIGNLGNLISLNLDSNQLATLPPEIGNLGNLIDLSLKDNQLTALPPEIGNLHLFIFDFANNPFILSRLSRFGFNSRIFSWGKWMLNHKAAVATMAAVGLTAIVTNYLLSYEFN